MMPGNAIKRHVVVEKRHLDEVEFANTTDLNKVENNGKKIGVITAGISYVYSKEALGDNVDYLKLGVVNPLPTTLVLDFCKAHDKVYIIEELDPFIEEHVKALGATNVIGKEVFTLLGEYTPKMIKKAVLNQEGPSYNEIAETIPMRPPVMCPGCPHRGTFYVLKKLGLTVSGDIGCYTLGAVAPLQSVDSTICMGASVSAGFGMAKARGKEFNKKLVSVIGDSTFIHSGITGLIDIVYNKGSNTIIILDNSITGMTGHQQNPTTGKTIRLEETSQVNLIKLAESVGVKRIVVADPFDVKNFEKVVKAEVEADSKVSANVEFVLGDNNLKPASEAKNAATVGNYAKSAIYEGTIITSTGCIATYTLTPDADGVNGTLSGVAIDSKGTLKIQPAADVTLSK
jgi:indolepyruvate ferredoxin oxidoreductase alpha subunit